MATTHHRRFTQKELRQPDEFQTFFDSIGDFVTTNLQTVAIAVGVCLLAGGVIWMLYLHSQSRAALAAGQFYDALNALGNKDYGISDPGFQAIASGDSSRTIGGLANLFLGCSYLAQNQPAKARDAIQGFLATGDAPMFRGAAFYDLGVAYEDLHELPKAADAYGQAAAIPGPEQDRAALAVARVTLAQGKRSDAIAAYQRFLSEHPFATERSQVVEALAALGVASPAIAPGAIPAPIARPAS